MARDVARSDGCTPFFIRVFRSLTQKQDTNAVIQRCGDSPILQNQQEPDQKMKVLPDSGAPVNTKAPV